MEPFIHFNPLARHYRCSAAMGRTNITVNDQELWKWAKKRAVDLEMRGVSEYLFHLVEEDRRRMNRKVERR